MKTRIIIRYTLITIVLLMFSTCVVSVFSDDDSKKSAAKTEEQTKAELLENKHIEDSLKIVQFKKDSIKRLEIKTSLKKLKLFRSETDEFEATTFYTDKRVPKYSNVNFIAPYIGHKNGRYWLRLKFRYTSSKWLFIDKIKIKTDRRQYEIIGKFERDNNSKIWEWRDIQVDKNYMSMLNDMATSKSVLVRYEGTKYQKDRKLTSKEKSIIKKTLDIYAPLK